MRRRRVARARSGLRGSLWGILRSPSGCGATRPLAAVSTWLYTGRADRLEPARHHLEDRALLASPMVLLELQYLHEIGRISVPAPTVFVELKQTMGLELAAEPWSTVVRTALSLSWTRDPFDRLIAAQALTAGVPLVTADQHIRTHFPLALWG